jgi:hypothetical protein
MSYSFNAKGATKAAALVAVAAEMEQVVASQPIHAKDAPLVHATVAAAADLVQVDDTKDVFINVNGSVSSSDWNNAEAPLAAVSLSLSVSLVTRSA